MLFILLVCLIPQILFAEKMNTDTLRVYHLGEVYVTAKRISDLPATVVEITKEDIEEQNAENLSEAITYVSGIFVSTGGKNSSEISIRGSQSKDVLIMADGRAINETYYGKLDLDMMPSDNIQRIKIVKGPASVLYGPNTKGGVVNILYQMPKKPHFNLHTLLGEGNTYKTSVSMGLPIGDFNWWVTYSKNHSNGWQIPAGLDIAWVKQYDINNDKILDNSGYDKQDISGKIVYNGFEDTKLAISAGYYIAKKDIPYRNWNFTNWKRSNFDVTATHKLNSKFNLKTKFYADFYQNDLLMDEITIENITDRELSRHDNHTLGANFNGEWKTSNHNVEWVYMLRKEIFGKQTLEPIKNKMENFTSFNDKEIDIYLFLFLEEFLEVYKATYSIS